MNLPPHFAVGVVVMDRTSFTTFGVGWMQIAGTASNTTATTTTTSQCRLRPIASVKIAGFLHTH